MQDEVKSRRRSLRRAVALSCSIRSELWDDEVSLPASNLSTDGVWLETPLALDPGAEVIVAFTPPGVTPSLRVWAAARVVRVGSYRRRDDPRRGAGMALTFTYCSERDRKLLARALRGCPPRLPVRNVPPPLPSTVAPSVTPKPG